MSEMYFALVREDLSKPWSYFITDHENLEELKKEVALMQDEGDLNPNAFIQYYKGEPID